MGMSPIFRRIMVGHAGGPFFAGADQSADNRDGETKTHARVRLNAVELLHGFSVFIHTGEVAPGQGMPKFVPDPYRDRFIGDKCVLPGTKTCFLDLSPELLIKIVRLQCTVFIVRLTARAESALTAIKFWKTIYFKVPEIRRT